MQRNQRELTAAWWAVVSRFLLHGLILSTWISRIPALQSSLSLTHAEFGLTLLGTALGSMFAIPATGWLVARHGSRRVTIWSTVGLSAALLARSWAANAATLFAALFVFGAMAGANDVSMNAQGVALEQAMAAPSLSRFHAMSSIGGMIGASIGGLLATHGTTPKVHLTLAAVVFFVASLLTAPPLFEAQDHLGKQARSRRLSFRRLPPVLLTLAVIGFCLFLSEGAMADWTGIYLKQALGASPGLAAAGYALFSSGMAFFRLLGDSLTARLGPVCTVRTGALLGASGLTLALASHSLTWALVGFAFTGVGFSVIVPLIFAAGGRLDAMGSGAGVAMVSGSGYMGIFFGPPLIGLLAQQTSLHDALSGLVALSMLAVALAPAVRADTEGC